MARKLTIGELSRRTGASVKTLRFYADEGLLPPAARSGSGYRLFTEEHVVRVELIRALREAGLGLDDIARVLRRDLPLEQVLALHLGTVEAHIVSLQRIAASLRLALRSGATEDQLRRITMVSKESNEDRRRVVAAFYEQVAAGTPASRSWIEGMIEASAPPLPEPPSADQLAAWIELEALLRDPTFLAVKRVNAMDAFAPRWDADAFLTAVEVATKAAEAAEARGVLPSSPEAAAVVEAFVRALASAAGADPEAMRAHLRTKYDPRGVRFWYLVAAMKGEPPPAPFHEWRWLGEAMRVEAVAA